MTDESNEFGSGSFGGQLGATRQGHFQGLIDDCLRAVGVSTTDEKYRARALVFLKNVQLNALKGRHWKFLNRELYIDLEQPYATGLVDLVQDSDTVIENPDELPAISWNSNYIGAKFSAGGDQFTARILKAEDSKTLRLAAKYPGESVSAVAYEIVHDRIPLDSKVHKLKSVIIRGYGEIRPLGLEKFRRMESDYPVRTGTPRYYTVVNVEEDSGQPTMEFYPAPDKRYSVSIEYISSVTNPEDSDTCFSVIPPDHMDVLYYGGVVELYAFQNNSSMVQWATSRYLDSQRRFASDHEMTDPVARIQHGRRYFRRRNNYNGFYGLEWFGKVDA